MRIQPLPLHWTERELHLLEEATTFSELASIARDILAYMKKEAKELVQVCGPIATGGYGSMTENLKEFEKAIAFLREKGFVVFDQMPFEEPMQRIKKNYAPKEAHSLVMNDFYLPLMQERHVTKYFFLPNWETSKGAKIEYDRAKSFNFDIIIFPENYREEYDK